MIRAYGWIGLSTLVLCVVAISLLYFRNTYATVNSLWGASGSVTVEPEKSTRTLSNIPSATCNISKVEVKETTVSLPTSVNACVMKGKYAKIAYHESGNWVYPGMYMSV